MLQESNPLPRFSVWHSSDGHFKLSVGVQKNNLNKKTGGGDFLLVIFFPKCLKRDPKTQWLSPAEKYFKKGASSTMTLGIRKLPVDVFFGTIFFYFYLLFYFVSSKYACESQEVCKCRFGELTVVNPLPLSVPGLRHFSSGVL